MELQVVGMLQAAGIARPVTKPEQTDSYAKCLPEDQAAITLLQKCMWSSTGTNVSELKAFVRLVSGIKGQ